MKQLFSLNVITHPFEGGHPDHDATAFAVHTACQLLERQGQGAPWVLEMTSYHNRAGRMATSEFLPRTDRPDMTRVFAQAQWTGKTAGHRPRNDFGLERMMGKYSAVHRKLARCDFGGDPREEQRNVT